jgi:hypothetical protein
LALVDVTVSIQTLPGGEPLVTVGFPGKMLPVDAEKVTVMGPSSAVKSATTD